MTALNAFARPDGAYLIADTAGYHHDGTLLNMRDKVLTCERLGMLIGTCGRVAEGVDEDIRQWLDRQLDAAAAIEDLPALARELAAFDAEASENGAAAHCGDIPEGLRILVALWDADADRAVVGLVATIDALSGGAEPFTFRPCATLFMPSLPVDLWPGHSFDPRRDAARLAEMQRAEPDDGGIHRVGGAMRLYRAHPGGIDRETIVAWPDEVGRPIEFAGAAA